MLFCVNFTCNLGSARGDHATPTTVWTQREGRQHPNSYRRGFVRVPGPTTAVRAYPNRRLHIGQLAGLMGAQLEGLHIGEADLARRFCLRLYSISDSLSLR